MLTLCFSFMLLSLLILFPSKSWLLRSGKAAGHPRRLQLVRNDKSDVHDFLAVVNLAAQRAYCEVGLVETEGM